MSINSFGCLRAPADARDRDYTVVSAIRQIRMVAKPVPRKRAYADGPLLNQGNTPQCVSYASRGFIDGAPILTKATVGPSPLDIYNGAQKNDEWPGTNYEGTSVRGAMKFLQDAGMIASYVWAQSVASAVEWMNGGYGTCIIGTNWYAEMSDVDRNGFMREPAPSLTTPIGGHAYRLIWWDAKKKGVLMRNSWGHEFGYLKSGVPSGYAFMSLELLERLFREDGELACPTQSKIKPLVQGVIPVPVTV